jgi:hypothetical protein
MLSFGFVHFLECILMPTPLALPPGAPRVKASAYATEISAVWKTLSPEEKEEFSTDAMQSLKEQRENKSAGMHITPLSKFHDARSTLAAMEKHVSTHYTLYLILF